MDNEFRVEIEYDALTDADRVYFKQLNSNERHAVEARMRIGNDAELVAVRHLSECWTLTGNPNFPDGLTFDVREIKDALSDPANTATVIRLPLNEWLYLRTLPNCDEPHIVSIDAERMEKPGIIVQLPDGTICMIDGNHRLCARYRAGLRVMRAVILNFDNIKPATFVPGTRGEIKVNLTGE